MVVIADGEPHPDLDDDVVAVVPADPAGATPAARLAARLGLPGHPEPAVRRALHRAEARRALFAAGIPHPEYRVLTPEVDAAHEARLVGLPAMVRPVSVLDGPDHRRVESAADARAAVAALDPGEAGLLVERSLEGRWLTDLAWIRDGSLMTDVVLEGSIDTADGVASGAPPDTRDLTAQVAGAIGLTDGAVTVELCVDGRLVRVVEVLPACPSRLVGRPLLDGRSPEAVSLELATGG